MPVHDAGYQHWQGHHLGIWHRRATIAVQGIHGCLQGKWMRHLILICWTISLAQVALLFMVGQLLVRDSMVVTWVANLNPDLQIFAQGLTAWIEQHPEISVRCTQNLLFFFFSTNLLGLSFIAIALALPHLISRDLASNAMVIYASKAINRVDYCLGKLGVMLGLLCMTWLGPLLTAWLMGNLLAPRWHFFWHARAALANTLFFALLTMGLLSVLALGVSAVSSREKGAVSLWIGAWLAGKMFVSMAQHGRPWLKHLSVSYDLEQVSLAIFRLGEDVRLAQDNIPVFGQLLRGIRAETLNRLNDPDLGGAVVALVILLTLAVVILAIKVRPK
jgi:ABC-2 type transport system permease protein